MSASLEELEATLYEGMHLGRTRTTGRRAPAGPGLALLTRARVGLRAFVKEHPNDPRALRLLSLAEESFLSYEAALRALEQAMVLSGRRDKRDLKRVTLLREAAKEWANLPITPDQLAALGSYLAEKIGDGPGERSFRWTSTWLSEHGFSPDQIARVIEALEARGAFSDMQVYFNVVRG